MTEELKNLEQVVKWRPEKEAEDKTYIVCYIDGRVIAESEKVYDKHYEEGYMWRDENGPIKKPDFFMELPHAVSSSRKQNAERRGLDERIVRFY